MIRRAHARRHLRALAGLTVNRDPQPTPDDQPDPEPEPEPEPVREWPPILPDRLHHEVGVGVPTVYAGTPARAGRSGNQP